MRLDRFVCRSTHLNKDQVTKVIQDGHVFVNGNPVNNPVQQVHENNTIILDGEKLRPRKPRYILMNKPADTICSNIDEAYPSLFNYLDIENLSELHIAGRLDADTTGLVLITDDGRWSYHVTHPQHLCEKVYRVSLRAPLTEEARTVLTKGVLLQGEEEPTHPAKIQIIHSKQVLLTITEGRFHQVKRMFAAVGNRVVALHREKIGSIQLNVDEGKWRYLTSDEVNALKR